MCDPQTSDLSDKTLLCRACARNPLAPAQVEKVDEEGDKVAVYETVQCPSCGEQFSVEQAWDSDVVKLDSGLITARQLDILRRGAARRQNQ